MEHHDMQALELLIKKVQFDHRLRLDLPSTRLVSRPYVPRPEPRTVIIAEAAKRAIENKEWAEG